MIGGGQTSYLSSNLVSEQTFSQIKRWLTSCLNTHAYCSPRGSAHLPLRVIDVGMSGENGVYPHPVLSVGTKRCGKYATLSYRWGDMKFMTTISTLDERIACMPLNNMPVTFQDAIEVTRRLGIQYLWIDALCIVQDSPQDWQEQSAIMGKIYADAWLNISVSSVSNSGGGFLKPRNLMEIRSCRHPSLLRDSLKGEKVICPNIPRHDRLQYRDILNSRGWILQERVLSKRTLHFGLYEVYWECLSLSASEREPESFELWSNASKFDRDSQDRRKEFNVIRSGVQYLANPDAETLLDLLGPEGMSFPCHDEEHDRWVLRNLSKSPQERKVLQFPCSHYHEQPAYAPASVTACQFVSAHHLWYLLVEEYTSRTLTNISDKLPAVSGLASIFHNTFGPRSKYIAGIWPADLLNGLAWYQRNDLDGSQLCANVRPFYLLLRIVRHPSRGRQLMDRSVSALFKETDSKETKFTRQRSIILTAPQLALTI
jgi:hypothetical protein